MDAEESEKGFMWEAKGKREAEKQVWKRTHPYAYFEH